MAKLHDYPYSKDAGEILPSSWHRVASQTAKPHRHKDQPRHNGDSRPRDASSSQQVEDVGQQHAQAKEDSARQTLR